jgi:hypothetical protein
MNIPGCGKLKANKAPNKEPRHAIPPAIINVIAGAFNGSLGAEARDNGGRGATLSAVAGGDVSAVDTETALFSTPIAGARIVFACSVEGICKLCPHLRQLTLFPARLTPAVMIALQVGQTKRILALIGRAPEVEDCPRYGRCRLPRASTQCNQKPQDTPARLLGFCCCKPSPPPIAAIMVGLGGQITSGSGSLP